MFLGMNSIILMGTHIGNNVIVGAGSVVHGRIPNDVVIAGNPAKIICTLEEHYKRRVENTKAEAISCARVFCERFGKEPAAKDMGEFYPLFAPRDLDWMKENEIGLNPTSDEETEVTKAFLESKPIWSSYEEFLEESLRE